MDFARLVAPEGFAGMQKRLWVALADEVTRRLSSVLNTRHIICSSIFVIAGGMVRAQEGPLMSQKTHVFLTTFSAMFTRGSGR